MDETSDLQVELDEVDAELELVDLQIAELEEKQTELNARKSRLLKRVGAAGGGPKGSSSSSSKAPVAAPPALSKTELERYDKAGFTLVITPLVSLMEDQLMFLNGVDVPAVCLNASSSREHAKMVMAGMTDPAAPFKLLYVTPEKVAKSKLLMSRLEKAYSAQRLSRIAVDEVHCCSQWGHDFRPDYKLLGILKRQFPTVPLLGLTATATLSVLKDCQKILCVPEPITITSSFNRTNLFYEVRVKGANNDSSMSDIATLIKTKYKDQSGIVYVFSQKDTEAVAAELQKQGVEAYPYHANLHADDKTKVHRKWSRNKIQVVVATVAFGMGIDKPDVRFVIHHTLSKSIENYYQESGRAGRDDKPADCVLYFGFADVFRISSMVVMENVGQQKLMQMVDYCQNPDRCRRSLMAVHFDEVWDDKGCNKMCDACKNGEDHVSLDLALHGRQVLQILEVAASQEEKVTPLKVVETWLGKGPAKRRKMIQTTELSKAQAEAVIVQLLVLDYLGVDFSFTPYTTNSYLKPGRKAPLLKSSTHNLTMKMRKTSGTSEAAGTSTLKVADQDAPAVTSDPVGFVGGPQQPNNQTKEQHQNPMEKQEPKSVQSQAAPTGAPIRAPGDAHTSGPTGGPIRAAGDAHTSGRSGVSEGREPDPPPRPVLPSAKRKSTTPQRRRRKPCVAMTPASAPVAVVTSPDDHHDPSSAAPRRPSSVISDAAAAELSDLRDYYSSQLRRIDYVSHEHLGGAAGGGADVLACIREPLRSLRLPRGASIGRTARSLWTRVSGRRKLVNR
ncbi:ATP-dependent DNA helicase Q1 isoform X2 [Gadus chalcogrammus]|uniref:ATP-dependent DNA helicase Q1 isoform X2 n=1 Tax=Gadus chalcogrammus TaxID=1042646 RepID=UPI0024C42654|nr:ATP-dependent DNA helicase Q1 isoform X2 [Gadus chalcogrammus]